MKKALRVMALTFCLLNTCGLFSKEVEISATIQLPEIPYLTHPTLDTYRLVTSLFLAGGGIYTLCRGFDNFGKKKDGEYAIRTRIQMGAGLVMLLGSYLFIRRKN